MARDSERRDLTSIDELLTQTKVIAVVGLSESPDRPSHGVARYLQEQGYRIIPVNPNLKGPVLGEQPYPDLEAVPEHIDLVDIFRRPNDVPPVVDAAIAVGATAVWMQLGIIHEDAARKARDAGLSVVMDRCTAIEHRALLRRRHNG
jgi:predicted CoA-binding protein